MSSASLEKERQNIQEKTLFNEGKALENLKDIVDLTREARIKVAKFGADLVAKVRSTTKPTLMEVFLAEYGLSTNEGLALMSLAEALLRVPDAKTIDELIEDKILGGDWSEHAGQSISNLVNVSTMGLQVTNAVLKEGEVGVVSTLQAMVKRLGMSVIRRAVKQVIKKLGSQFVLGETIEKASSRADYYQEKGFTYSYDMLGEAAYTAEDAKKYYMSYEDAMTKLISSCKGGVRENPGISVKLSALHPRYEVLNKKRVIEELVPRVLALAIKAKGANMGFNIDAEEADRLDLSLSVIEEVLFSPYLEGWDGFGVVVQAYGRRAPHVIDWLYTLAQKLNRKIMVRLVKGAYWDMEIKRAQVLGLKDFPVFTQKSHTDMSYIACTKKLFELTDRIYPQFATHNAHTVAAVQYFSKGTPRDQFEFQRLHGMGESLYGVLMREEETRCRIYAPVGIQKDLLAYLVRRLLENGANSSFVNQIVDTAIPPKDVAADPYEVAKTQHRPFINTPMDILGKDRTNSKGWDITDEIELKAINKGRADFKNHIWQFDGELTGNKEKITNPANLDIVGEITLATVTDCKKAFFIAESGVKSWASLPMDERAKCLERAANLLEQNTFELFAIATQEAGKSLPDAISEIREAVDFLRYYAKEARSASKDGKTPRGIFVCISPWNFPLAIFLGQVSAALVMGNAVLAKPAEQTPLIALRAGEFLHQAGVPKEVLQILPGDGATIGSALTSHENLSGVCFTGSINTAQTINRSMANHTSPLAPLIAETGGLNAMIVDSTALPEQAIQDIVASSFQSAGQRCSALRMLYIQEDVKENFLKMLYGAMDELKIGNPWDLDTDVGPVIDDEARKNIIQYCEKLEANNKLLKKVEAPIEGRFVAPALFKVEDINDLDKEVFGPILHVATFKAKNIYKVMDDINNRGFGLTLGLHTRIDDRVEYIKSKAKVGNLYINRNQIGAVVGCQPFGGEGLSGTGPKAGGPSYLDVFAVQDNFLNTDPQKISDELPIGALNTIIQEMSSQGVDLKKVRARLRGNLAKVFPKNLDLIEKYMIRLEKYSDTQNMPSPVGESNELSLAPRGVIMCVGTGVETLLLQIIQAVYFGNKVVSFSATLTAPDEIFSSFPVLFLKLSFPTSDVVHLKGVDVIAYFSDFENMKIVRQGLAKRDGPIIPLVCDFYAPFHYYLERHCCVDTTASGGDALLLSGGGTPIMLGK